MSAFEELGVCPEIIQAVEEDDWLLPSAVQQEAIPLILTGGDVLAAAETGSGKTGAFGLPCLQIVHETLRGKCKTADPGSSLKSELNVSDRDMNLHVTEDGLECKSEDPKKWNGVRATVEVLQGKYMYEVEVVEGMLRVGWSSTFARLELGMEEKSFGFGSTGKKSSNRSFEEYGEEYKEGDIIGCLLDREKQALSFFKNGKDLGVAFELPDDLADTGLKPHICGKGFRAVCKFDGPMEYPVEGFAPLGEIDPAHGAVGTSRPKGGRPPMCMILEPTRDLAEQTYSCINKFSKYLREPTVKTALFVGGQDDKDQVAALEAGIDIAVGTLQKCMDHVRREKLDIRQIKFFVLDEADDLQKKDDRKDIQQLNEQIKRGRKDRIQTLLFSATLHTQEIHQLIEDITTNPVWVDLKGKDAVPETVHHVVYYVDPTKDLIWSDSALAERAKYPDEQPVLDGVHLKPSMSEIDTKEPDKLRMSERIKKFKPKLFVKIADAFKMSQCLVFCRTNVECNNLEAYLNKLDGTRAHRGKFESGKENPYSCVVLGGARSQKERRENLEAFKEGDVRFLLATDVAARGIDVAQLPFVIQMTLSDDIENYIHRIGRCGRAERMGLAISLVGSEREKVWYHKCPSKGKNCQPAPGNTKLTIPFGPDGKLLPANQEKWLVDEGGCTVWYDEPEILKKVEARIGRKMAVMDAEDFSVPRVLDSPLPGAKKKVEDEDMEPVSRRGAKRKKSDVATVVYGAKANDAKTTAAKKEISVIAPVVVELAGLETKIQQMFSRHMWGIQEGEGAATAATSTSKSGLVLASMHSPALTSPSAAAPSATSTPATGAVPEPAAKKPKKMRW